MSKMENNKKDIHDKLAAIPEKEPDAIDLAMIEQAEAESENSPGSLCENKELYQNLGQAIKNVYFDIHAIYEPDENGWYCAAIDLFQRGMTFRVYFVLDEEKQIEVKHLERWWFG